MSADDAQVTPQAIIALRNLYKTFPGGVRAVEDVNLDIFAGEFFALLGPSGCGKTTLLRMLAGFERPSSGSVLLDGVDVSGVPPNRRPLNMVFQSYAVFPHMNVQDNVAYGLKIEGVALSESRQRVGEALDLVKLSGFGKRHPDQLSGGQRQRVALARALVKRPKVLLLDEPLSALDAKLRETMQLELVGLQKTVGITFVIVTHDQDEALSMADRIAVMEGGMVRQVASPPTLYEFPADRFVADFIGKMNLFEATVTVSGEGYITVVSPDLGTIQLPGDHRQGMRVGLAVRPEKIQILERAGTDEAICIETTIDRIAYHGSESRAYFNAESGVRIMATFANQHRDDQTYSIGEKRWLRWAVRDTLVLGV